MADDANPKSSHELWLNAGVFAYHFDRKKDLRGNNYGLGLEFFIGEAHALWAGTFINSNNTRSRYAAYRWRPLQWQGEGVKAGLDIAAGAIDGYPNYHGGAWFPLLLPSVAIETRYVGINLFAVPTIRNRTDGAVAIQLKVRVW